MRNKYGYPYHNNEKFYLDQKYEEQFLPIMFGLFVLFCLFSIFACSAMKTEASVYQYEQQLNQDFVINSLPGRMINE